MSYEEKLFWFWAVYFSCVVISASMMFLLEMETKGFMTAGTAATIGFISVVPPLNVFACIVILAALIYSVFIESLLEWRNWRNKVIWEKVEE